MFRIPTLIREGLVDQNQINIDEDFKFSGEKPTETPQEEVAEESPASEPTEEEPTPPPDGNEPKTPETETPEEQNPPTDSKNEPGDSWLTEATNGVITTRGDLAQAMQELTQLREEVKKPKEIEFQNEGQKKAYEFVLKFNEKEQLPALNRYLSLQNFDLSKATQEETLFENFLLEHPKLSREIGREAFKEMQKQKYPELYAEPEEGEEKPQLSAYKRLLYDEEVEKATESIQKHKSEFDEGSKVNYQAQAQEEQRQQLQQALEPEIKNFKGLNMSFDFAGDEAKILAADPANPDKNLSIDVPKDKMEEFTKAIQNPQEMYKKFMLDEKGQLNPKSYINFIFKNLFGDLIDAKMVKHGYEQGKLEVTRKNKNIPKGPPDPKGPPVPKGDDDLGSAIERAIEKSGWKG